MLWQEASYWVKQRISFSYSQYLPLDDNASMEFFTSGRNTSYLMALKIAFFAWSVSFESAACSFKYSLGKQKTRQRPRPRSAYEPHIASFDMTFDMQKKGGASSCILLGFFGLFSIGSLTSCAWQALSDHESRALQNESKLK